MSPYYVLEYADWVQIVAVDDLDRVVLVEQYRHGIGRISLELPAGTMEGADVDAVDAGRRELLEETGCVADSWRRVATLAPNPANQSNLCHVLLAQGLDSWQPPLDDPTERLRVVRVPVAEVVRRARDGGIAQSMHVAALALALTELGKW